MEGSVMPYNDKFDDSEIPNVFIEKETGDFYTEDSYRIEEETKVVVSLEGCKTAEEIIYKIGNHIYHLFDNTEFLSSLDNIYRFELEANHKYDDIETLDFSITRLIKLSSQNHWKSENAKRIEYRKRLQEIEKENEYKRYLKLKKIYEPKK